MSEPTGLSGAPDSWPTIVCARCEHPMRVCRDCLAMDWWYLYCERPHCVRQQACDYTHKHAGDQRVDAGERRYRWEPARKTEKLRPNLRPDAEGRVRVRVFLVDETRQRLKGGQLQLGNRQRTITVARGTVGEVAEQIEAALFSGERRTTEAA